jgi:hypothetical protein
MAKAAKKSIGSHTCEEGRVPLSALLNRAHAHPPIYERAQIKVAKAWRSGRLPLRAKEHRIYKLRWPRQLDPPTVDDTTPPNERRARVEWVLLRVADTDVLVPQDATPAYHWGNTTMSYLDGQGQLREYRAVTASSADVDAVWTPKALGGRPSSHTLILAEAKRRLKDKDEYVPPSFKEFANELSKWLATKHPQEPSMGPGRVEKCIGELRRQFKERKNVRKQRTKSGSKGQN